MLSWFQTFVKKTNIFNNFFAYIYTPTDNASCLPSFSYRTGSRIKSFYVTENDILAIMKTLDPNKALGCDNISIKMIKICCLHLFYLQKLFSNILLKKVNFQKNGKRQMQFLSIKKGDKMLVKNYRPISLLFLEKCLKELYIIPFSTNFKVIGFSHLLNLVFF